MTSDNWRGATWEVGFEHYECYVRESGGPVVSVDYVADDGFRLGRWVNTQRVHRRSGRLKPERFDLLDHLGLQWDPKLDLQRSMLQASIDFRRREGHADIPYDYRTEAGLALGKWISAQRARKAKGTLDAHVAAELEALGVRWENASEVLFDRGVTEMRLFVESTGSTHVPIKYISESGFALGAWYQAQKTSMSKDMAQDRRSRLEGLGIEPERDVREEVWQSAFDLLKSWVDAHGSVSFSRNYVTEDGYRLGQWLWVQRSWLKSGRLKESRRLQLDALHEDWHASKPKWTTTEGLEALREASTMAFPLGASDYVQLRSSRLLIGPSHAWFIQKHGSWAAACAAADVECAPSREGWSPYSTGDVTQALEDFFDLHDRDATADGYKSWAIQNGAPSIGVVLRRVGTWAHIQRTLGGNGSGD